MSNPLKIMWFFLIPWMLTAQNPGYEGKKFSLGIEAQGMPVVGALMINEDWFDFNLRYGLSLDYVFSKRLSAGVKIHRSEDLVFLINYSVSTLSPLEIGQLPSWYSSNISSFESVANYSYTGYGVFFKLFSKEFGSIAPLGQYFSFEYQLGHIDVSDDGRFFNYNRSEIYSNNTHSFSVGTGIQNIYFNRLIVGMSFNLSINSLGIRSLVQSDKYGGHKYIELIERKAFSDGFLNTRMSLAWLLF